jgi:hypothetical protein
MTTIALLVTSKRLSRAVLRAPAGRTQSGSDRFARGSQPRMAVPSESG